jgi:hypothetical protein
MMIVLKLRILCDKKVAAGGRGEVCLLRALTFVKYNILYPAVVRGSSWDSLSELANGCHASSLNELSAAGISAIH